MMKMNNRREDMKGFARMNISIWDIFRYIFKWKYIIIIELALSVFAAYGYVQSRQTYNSTAVIELNDECIKSGKALDNSTYDYYEIVSPNVITNVINDLGLSKSVDSLRRKVTVTPIIPESEKEIKESKEKSGEKHEYYPNIFSVTYTGGVGESAADVRNILASIVDNYVNYYTEKYVQLSSVNDVAYNEEMGSYDYIDMAEMIRDNLDDITAKLEGYSAQKPDFRSTSTGLSFSDLSKEYGYLKDFAVPEIFADIYAGQVTKNKQLLIETYTGRKEQYMVERQNYIDAANIAKTRMESFSSANIDVPNSYNTPTGENDDKMEIINGVHDGINPYNTVTTYDNLMDSYVDKNVAANTMLLKAQNCDEVLAKFSAPLPKGTDTDIITARVNKNLKEAKDKITELNNTTNKVIADYNAYESTVHVAPLTGENYYATMSTALYILIAVVVVGFLGIIIALTVEIVLAMKKQNAKTEESND